MRLLTYHAAVLSALTGPLWMPDRNAHGWPVAFFMAWLLCCWLIFVSNQPLPKRRPGRSRKDGAE